MKEFINKQVREHEKHLHELRINITALDDYYWEAQLNRVKIVVTDEQLQILHAREEENRRKNYNAFADPKYWTPEYLERKYADMELKDYEQK